MKTINANSNNKSLGTLRIAEKTKPRSPDLIGQVTLQSKTLHEIVKQYEKSGERTVTCNIAAWRYTDKNGANYLSVEISPWFVPAEQRKSKSTFFDALFNNEDE